jgi:N-acetylmuramoyl-L-alanine amidase
VRYRVRVIVAIDPGHGGLDPRTGEYVTAGKRAVYAHGPLARVLPGGLLAEGRWNRRAAAMLASELYWHGLTPYSTVDDDEITSHNHIFEWRDVPIRVRRDRARLAGAWLTVSIHSNALKLTDDERAAGLGQERRHGASYWTRVGQDWTDEVAELMIQAHKAAQEAIGVRVNEQRRHDGDGDWESDRFGMLYAPNPILIERAYHNHPRDAARIVNDEAMRAWARAIGEAIRDAAVAS